MCINVVVVIVVVVTSWIRIFLHPINKGVSTSSKKLLVPPGITIRNKKLLVTMAFVLVARSLLACCY